MVISGLNYAVNLEILNMVSRNLYLTERNGELTRAFYSDVLDELRGISEAIKR